MTRELYPGKPVRWFDLKDVTKYVLELALYQEQQATDTNTDKVQELYE
jgi:hypothetical protein